MAWVETVHRQANAHRMLRSRVAGLRRGYLGIRGATLTSVPGHMHHSNKRHGQIIHGSAGC